MEATGISFAEQQMRRGTYFDQPLFPFVPGYDLVGRAVDVGEGVREAVRLAESGTVVVKVVLVPRTRRLRLPPRLRDPPGEGTWPLSGVRRGRPGRA